MGGKELKLNGAGMRAIVFIKFYAIGLYLPEKKSTPAEVQAEAAKRHPVVGQGAAHAAPMPDFARQALAALKNSGAKA